MTNSEGIKKYLGIGVGLGFFLSILSSFWLFNTGFKLQRHNTYDTFLALLKACRFEIFVYFGFNLLIFGLLYLSFLRAFRIYEDGIENTIALINDLNEDNLQKREPSKLASFEYLDYSLKGLHAKLRMLEKGRKQLLDAIVHQSVTPITILKTHIEGMQDHVIESDDETLEICSKQVEVVSEMIDNISHMIESDGTSNTIKLERISIPDLVKQVTKSLEIKMARKEIEFKMDGPKQLSIMSDAYKLSQVLYHLIQNAYRYTPRGGKVHVEYAILDKIVNICVSDTGLGIPEHEQEKIFEPYFRGESSTGINGEGIGLYTAKLNINLLGGNISVRSKTNEGSAFIVKLPTEQLLNEIE